MSGSSKLLSPGTPAPSHTDLSLDTNRDIDLRNVYTHPPPNQRIYSDNEKTSGFGHRSRTLVSIASAGVARAHRRSTTRTRRGVRTRSSGPSVAASRRAASQRFLAGALYGSSDCWAERALRTERCDASSCGSRESGAARRRRAARAGARREARRALAPSSMRRRRRRYTSTGVGGEPLRLREPTPLEKAKSGPVVSLRDAKAPRLDEDRCVRREGLSPLHRALRRAERTVIVVL